MAKSNISVPDPGTLGPAAACVEKYTKRLSEDALLEKTRFVASTMRNFLRGKMGLSMESLVWLCDVLEIDDDDRQVIYASRLKTAKGTDAVGRTSKGMREAQDKFYGRAPASSQKSVCVRAKSARDKTIDDIMNLLASLDGMSFDDVLGYLQTTPLTKGQRDLVTEAVWSVPQR